MQVCFLGLQAFSTLCQSVDFVNILKRPSRSGRGASEKIAYSSTISATGAFSRTEAMPFSQLSLAL